MGYDIGWIIPRLRSPGLLWNCASSITVAVVGLFSKIVIEWLNKTTVYNAEGLARALRRPPGVPLLTVSNHHSCFDDPGLWGVLELRTLLSRRRMRWSLAAHDICFTRALHAAFFALGKCVPVVRGAGVYQPAIDFCIERLNRGEWVHIFPEGRVNVDKEHIRLKWGVGRMIGECSRPPLVLPVWHEGMDRILPNAEPYLLQFRRRALLSVGQPIQLDSLLASLRKSNASEEESRAAITARIQDELLRLRNHTHRRLVAAAGPAADGLLQHRTDILTNPSDDAPYISFGHEMPNGKEKEKEKDI
ncbi:tafazzin [Plutella xylostella]|uniref:tafazzin n=1 Tax=Plutella xylostella TaxID=51655 RepID=UPI002032702D|nr:tafazzin [Plutella xylostella]